MIVQAIDCYFGIGSSRDEKKAKEILFQTELKGNELATGIIIHHRWDTSFEEKAAFQIFKENCEKDPQMEEKETKYFKFYLGR